jgi:hypothetical protein
MMLKANDPLIDGVAFTIGGDVYTAPPLTLGGIKAVLPRLTGNAAEVLSAVLCVSLKRNYPDVTQPWLDESMTGGEFRQSAAPLADLMRISGLVAAETDPGEAPAAA